MMLATLWTKKKKKKNPGHFPKCNVDLLVLPPPPQPSTLPLPLPTITFTKRNEHVADCMELNCAVQVDSDSDIA